MNIAEHVRVKQYKTFQVEQPEWQIYIYKMQFIITLKVDSLEIISNVPLLIFTH
jgi:hypothetical protein